MTWRPFDATMVRATRTSKQRIGWIRKATTLHVQHTFLYTSMTSRHDYDVKMPNFTLYGGLKQTKKFSFSFWTWIWFLRISTSGEFAYIWQSKGVLRIIAKTIERTRILFLSDVFAAIALLGSSVTVHNNYLTSAVKSNSPWFSRLFWLPLHRGHVDQGWDKCWCDSSVCLRVAEMQINRTEVLNVA